mmetsp:Transcript_95622/g.276261  ORF Transcript_95622/g.276261 Transcript_95622/m.276261 type:complete len:570 (-) Transcript_95622:120-1829(-)
MKLFGRVAFGVAVLATQSLQACRAVAPPAGTAGGDMERCALADDGDAASMLAWNQRAHHVATAKGRRPVYHNKPRVRREWRTLSQEVKDKVVRAFWTLKNLSTEEGQRIYGKHFHNHDDMLFLHICSTKDPRCDQGHFGPHFMTFHRSLLLKYELALLSVEPSIEAMPYWNIAYDAVDGKYRNDAEKYFFSDNFIGSFYGTGPNHEVEDGLFKNWPVEKYSSARFGASSPLATQDGKTNRCIKDEWFVPEPCSCNESSCPTYLRDASHQYCSGVVARWPKDPNGQMFMQSDGTALNPDGQGGTWEIVFSEEDWDKCADPRRTQTWMQWQNCIEMSTSSCFVPGTEEYVLRNQVLPSLLMKKAHDDQTWIDAVNKVVHRLVDSLAPNCTDSMLLGYYKNGPKPHHRGHVPYFHSQAHIKFGIDLLDVATSPNEAAAFTGYHADIDRNSFHWMYAARHLEAARWTYPTSQSNASAARLSGSPPYGTSGPFGLYDRAMCGDSSHFNEYTGDTPWLPGTLWDDVINAGFPFFNLFECYDGGEQGYTHGDVLRLTSPERTPYTYDTLEHLYYQI